MQVLSDAWSSEELPSPSVATVGNFDGIHRGQHRVISTTVGRARALDIGSVVVTFEPHPLDVLRKQRPPQRLTLRDQKRKLIERIGVDTLAEIEFSPRFASTSAPSFVESFLVGKLGVRELYVGSKFRFGQGREGDLELLEEMGGALGFQVHGLEEEEYEEGTISSTRIRDAVRAGRVESAAEMLDRSFAVVGIVIHGEGRGKKHGWPTMNVDVEHDLMPADGVYASEVWLPESQQLLPGVTNIGSRPTFPGSSAVVVETHIFDFDRDIYGQRVELGFAGRIRGETRFDSVEALIRQIEDDASSAREYLSRKDCSHIVPTL